jgi:uncharacterized phage protein (TIGR01671 family)
MRDILFRGRRKDNEWVEGYYLHKPNDICIGESNESHQIIKYYFMDWDLSKIEYFDVESYSVGQFIGLTDKNGKKIFEGDILQNDQLPYMINGRSIYFHEVVWMNDVSAFGLYVHKNPKSRANGLSHGEMQYIDNFDASEWEIVGNIHDNSDMLL